MTQTVFFTQAMHVEERYQKRLIDIESSILCKPYLQRHSISFFETINLKK